MDMQGILAHFRRARKPILEWPQLGMIVLIAISLLFRGLWLDHIPGLSGDEALGAVMGRRFLKGETTQWITPTGRLYDPFFTPLLFLIQLFPSSGWLLRLPAFLNGALTAILAWPLLRRTLPESNARIATVWIACLPLLIAYSRISWEPCQIPLVALLVTYFGLQNNLLGVTVSMIAAVLIHTVDIFLLPIGLAPIASSYWQRSGKLPKAQWLLSGAVLGLIISVLLWRSVPAHLHPPFPRPSDAYHFWRGISRIFSGVLAFGGFSALPPAWLLSVLDGVFMLGLPLICFLGFRRLEPRLRVFAVGVAISMLCLFVFGGQNPVSIGYERHCLYLAVPATVLLAMYCPASRRALGVSYAIAVALLGSFAALYFTPILQTGGLSFHGYHSGPVDPKAAASGWILKVADPTQPLHLLAEDWWAYWVVNYFVTGDPSRSVQMKYFEPSPHMDPKERIRNPQTLQNFFKNHGYAIGYSGGKLEWAIHPLRSQGLEIEETEFKDYAGVSFIKVWHLRNESRTE
jgi:hypothetical protein